MIKLIASDMDGTLLNENGQVPTEFFDTFKKLKEKGIEFVVASGRPYKTLYENFKPISDELLYIADNGAMIVKDKKILSVEIIKEDLVKKIIESTKNIENTTLVLCGMKGAYHIPCNQDLLKEIDKYYIEKHIVNSYDEINDDIFKISICDMNGAENNSFPIVNPILGQSLKTVVAGKYWVDFTNKGVNKGSAIEKLQKSKSITKEETMAFGDYFNDVEMLSKAYYSYVMENSPEEMKQYGNFIAESNKKNGVIKAISEIL